MVQKLSEFLSTSLSQALDSSEVLNIIRNTKIFQDSGTSGPSVARILAGDGIVKTNSELDGHHTNVTVGIDSSLTATVNTAQTLSNKTINLSNNTLVGTLGQFNAAVSGDTLASLDRAETFTNKTLTAPQITEPTIVGPASITKVSTFGLRDVTKTIFDTRFVSNNDSADSGTHLTANRTVTLKVNDANRLLNFKGDLKLGNDFITSGSGITITADATSSVKIPASGTIVTKDDSANIVIAGRMTADSFVGDGSALTGITKYDSTNFDSDFGTKSTANLSEDSTAKYFTIARARSSMQAGTGIQYDSATGVITSNVSLTIDSAFFDSSVFSVTSGNVTVKDSGISNAMLHTDTVTILGNVVALGGSLNFNTDSVPEGDSNQYYTSTRVDSDITAKVTKAFVDALSINATTLAGHDSSYYRIDVYNASGALLN